VIEVRVCDDIAVLSALRRAWNEEDHGSGSEHDAGFDARFATWFEAERDTRTFFVVEVDGVPVGMANLKRYDRMPATHLASAGWWGYVGNVFVVAEHRNGGVGQALMDGLLEWAKDHGYERVRLAPSERARPFYERLGYVPGAVVQRNP
jgi:GNAT superfamily N-acetyltransferase